MQGARNLPAVMVRMPDDLRVYLKHAAVDNHRSMNNEVIVRLLESRKQEEKTTGAVK